MPGPQWPGIFHMLGLMLVVPAARAKTNINIRGGEMKICVFTGVVAALLAPIPSIGADHSPQLDGPPTRIPGLPQTRLIFTRANGDGTQSLKLRYVDARTIRFRFDKSGICSRLEEGTATATPYGWLGAETDENDAGEAVAVSEYVYNKNSNCMIYFRIDEAGWSRASISEAAECNSKCPASEEPMSQ